MSFRKRTRKLGCILPGRSSSSSTRSRGQRLKDEEDDDCCSHLLIEDNDEMEHHKSYNLSRHEEDEEEELHPLNDTSGPSNLNNNTPLPSLLEKATAVSPAPGMTLSDSSSACTWPEMTQSFPDLELDQSSILDQSSLSSTMTPSSLKSANWSAPNSPHPTIYSCASSLYNCSSSLQSSPLSVHSAPVTPTRRSSRLPLTSPLPRRRTPTHQRSQSASNLLLPLSLQPPPCKQVEDTMNLLKSIKQQIKALKRRESHLSTKLQVQRRERQQMQDQIAHLEGRRLRVEAMFLRPMPLVLLLPVAYDGDDDEYDLCLVSEGHDAWNALQPLIRIQLLADYGGRRRHQGRCPLLIHFGPTLTQPMAATVSFLQQSSSSSHEQLLPHADLQPMIQQMDKSFWQRVTCGQVLEPEWSHQLSEASCQFLFDALTEHDPLWRHQLTQVVDKKTRRMQWILQQEADSLYYQAIPSSPAAAATALVELD